LLLPLLSKNNLPYDPICALADAVPKATANADC
jgi:hypothetical protein